MIIEMCCFLFFFINTIKVCVVDFSCFDHLEEINILLDVESAFLIFKGQGLKKHAKNLFLVVFI